MLLQELLLEDEEIYYRFADVYCINKDAALQAAVPITIHLPYLQCLYAVTELYRSVHPHHFKVYCYCYYFFPYVVSKDTSMIS